MEKKWTIAQAVQAALNEADRKFKAGKLYVPDHPEWTGFEFIDGDPETIYTISLLYSSYCDEHPDVVAPLIEDALRERYPAFA